MGIFSYMTPPKRVVAMKPTHRRAPIFIPSTNVDAPVYEIIMERTKLKIKMERNPKI